MVGTVGSVGDQSDVLHLAQNRDSMSRDDTQGTLQHVLDKGWKVPIGRRELVGKPFGETA